MPHNFYITPSEYQIAASNGIAKDTLEYRVRTLAWDITKAITTPPKPQKRLCAKWRKLAELNGIPYPAFQKRVNVYGWDEERAATEPLQDRGEHIKRVIAAQRRNKGVLQNEKLIRRS